MDKLKKNRFESLKSKKAISQLFEIGKSGRSGFILAKAIPSDRLRVAVIAPKRTGNAVKRNRMKRRMRAVIRIEADAFPDSDIAVIARREVLNMPFAELQGQIRKAVLKALR